MHKRRIRYLRGYDVDLVPHAIVPPPVREPIRDFSFEPLKGRPGRGGPVMVTTLVVHETRSADHVVRMSPGLTSGSLAPFVPGRKNTAAHVMACKRRFLCGPPHEITASDLRALQAHTDWICHTYLKPCENRMTVWEWLQRTHYSLKRKLFLMRLAASMDWDNPDRSIQSFVKDESYPEYKAPRMINARNDEFKVFAGPLAKAIEDMVYLLPCFVKHVAVALRPAYVMNMLETFGNCFAMLQTACPCSLDYYVTDHSRFECHMTTAIMQAIELRVYRYLLARIASPREIDMFCSIAQDNRFGNPYLHGKRPAGRMSGDMVTSVGNGLTNLVVASYILKSRSIPFSMVVEGDDGLFCVPHGTEIKAEWYEKLGFAIKLKQVREPGDSGFCGMEFVDDHGILQTIVEPFSTLADMIWTEVNTPLEALSRIRATALSMICEYPSCPVVTEYAKYLLRTTPRLELKARKDWYTQHILRSNGIDFTVDDGGLRIHSWKHLLDRCTPPTGKTRTEFHNRYGISEPLQIRFEQWCRSSSLTEFEDSPLASWIPPATMEHAYQHVVASGS